jgi:hypothetical protein
MLALSGSAMGAAAAAAGAPVGRGLHSFTSQLNLSAFYGFGDAIRDCVAVLRGW